MFCDKRIDDGQRVLYELTVVHILAVQDFAARTDCTGDNQAIKMTVPVLIANPRIHLYANIGEREMLFSP
jgi:hypothetical protein